MIFHSKQSAPRNLGFSGRAAGMVLAALLVMLLAGCVGVDGQPLLLFPVPQQNGAAAATASTDAAEDDAAAAEENAATNAEGDSASDTTSAEADLSGVELAEPIRVEAGYYLFQPIAGANVEISGESVETRGPEELPDGFTPLELYLTGARITAENSPLNAMPLQTVFQVIMGDILMDGAKMGPPFAVTLQDAPGMAADFTAPPPVAGESQVAGRVLMIIDPTHIFMMMGLGPIDEWDSSGSAQFQRILETVRFLEVN